MQEYALDMVHDGRTTLDEVQRVVTLSQSTTATCTACGRDLAPSFAFCPYCGTKHDVWGLHSSPRSDTAKEVVLE